MEDGLKEDKKQDVQIAVMTQEMKHFGQRIDSLTDVVKRFIEISEKKLDRDIYLDDRRKTEDELRAHNLRLQSLEDFQKGTEFGQKAKETEQKKIWGMSNGTLGLIINLLTLITLVAAVFKLFS